MRGPESYQDLQVICRTSCLSKLPDLVNGIELDPKIVYDSILHKRATGHIEKMVRFTENSEGKILVGSQRKQRTKVKRLPEHCN